MDESVTGSANFFGPVRESLEARRSATIARMHLRPPSIDPGVTSFLWALGLGVYIWAGLLAVGVSKPTAFIVAALAAFGIFLAVRVFGEEEPRRQRSTRGRAR